MPGVDLEQVSPAPADIAPAIDAIPANRDALERIQVHEMAAAAAAASRPLTILVNDPHRCTDTPSFLAALFEVLDEHFPAAEQLPTLRMAVAQVRAMGCRAAAFLKAHIRCACRPG